MKRCHPINLLIIELLKVALLAPESIKDKRLMIHSRIKTDKSMLGPPTHLEASNSLVQTINNSNQISQGSRNNIKVQLLHFQFKTLLHSSKRNSHSHKLVVFKELEVLQINVNNITMDLLKHLEYLTRAKLTKLLLTSQVSQGTTNFFRERIKKCMRTSTTK
jgi:hypothetical protein